jgi:Zn-dependent metalloprotease
MASFLVALLIVGSMQNSSSAQVEQSVKMKIFQKGTSEERELAKTLSLNLLRERADKYGIKSIGDLKVERVFVDELSMAHTRLQQTVEGVPVFGGEAIVHLKSDGSLFSITDSLIKDLQVNINPSLTDREAINLAVADYGCSDCLTDKPEADLLILRREDGDHLGYRVKLRRMDGSAESALPVIFIDAHTGQKVFEYNNLQAESTTATGSSLYNGSVLFNTWHNSTGIGDVYYLEDVGRKIGTFDCANSYFSGEAHRFLDFDNNWFDDSQKTPVAAEYAAQKFIDYFKNIHSRDGINGSGGPGTRKASDFITPVIALNVHYGKSYNNAVWDPDDEQAFFGDGDGVEFSPLVSQDVVGHELTHGVIQYTANLTYSGESGALNESWADVFGCMVERYIQGENSGTWLLGEDVYTPAVARDASRYMKAIRNMENPHDSGDYVYTIFDQPDHYSELPIGFEDSFDVHYTSGIANKAFHLLAKGGSHHKGGRMSGIGPDDAAKIWYKALFYMTSSTNFQGARTATLNAASALFGIRSLQYSAVAQAWTLCGVN